MHEGGLFWMLVAGVSALPMGGTIVLGMVRAELAREERRRSCGEGARRTLAKRRGSR